MQVSMSGSLSDLGDGILADSKMGNYTISQEGQTTNIKHILKQPFSGREESVSTSMLYW